MIRKLRSSDRSGPVTLLGVGPMSQNVVQAVVNLTDAHNCKLMLIASRRQIDSEEFGGGYVNDWTTATFANYVRKKDTKCNIVLARDHGGPWQNNLEVQQKLSISQAMASAKRSYEADIDAGFDILHIDPSIDIHETPTEDQVMDRVFELYEHCWAYARKKNVHVEFEVGTEEQREKGLHNVDLLASQLDKLSKFCKSSNIPKPLFVVVQTGTKVMETKNIGSFDKPTRVDFEIPSELLVPRIIDICDKYNVMMKQHNTDYLSDNALLAHPRLGIHAANVAPEFGVAETLRFLDLMRENQMSSEIEQFVDLALVSKKYEKWMLPESDATDYDKAVICGHYLFSMAECLELKRKLADRMNVSLVKLDEMLTKAVEISILRYMNCFSIL